MFFFSFESIPSIGLNFIKTSERTKSPQWLYRTGQLCLNWCFLKEGNKRCKQIVTSVIFLAHEKYRKQINDFF